MSNQPEKKLKRKTIYALFIILILSVVAVSYIFLRGGDDFYTMHGIKETKITNIYTSSRNQNYTVTYENNDWKASYELGKTLTIHEPLYTNATDAGTTKLISVECQTAGFSLTDTSPFLPTDVPYVFNTTAATKTLNLVFQTPTTPYSGVFEYTMTYDFTFSSS